MVVKKTNTKAAAKVVAAKPTVTVETKKISSVETCCSPANSCCRLGKHFFMILLLVVNTVLLAIVLINQSRMEALRAGGRENYGLLKQVFQTEGYKMQQKQQLEQALQILSQPQQATPSAENMQLTPEQIEQVQQAQPQQ